jgi:hypothetical protein
MSPDVGVTIIAAVILAVESGEDSIRIGFETVKVEKEALAG